MTRYEKTKEMSKQDFNNFLAHMFNKMMEEKISHLPVPKIPFQETFDISASDVAQYLNQEIKPFPNLFPGDIVMDINCTELIVLPWGCFYDTDKGIVISPENGITPENCIKVNRVICKLGETECKEIWHRND